MSDQEKPNSKTKGTEITKKKSKRKKASLYALQIFLWTFVLSLSFSAISEFLMSNTGLFVAFTLLVFLIVINIVFDIIAVSVTSSSVEPFLAMASKKMHGAKTAVKIVKNAEKVSNICGDVIGDICGIVSGALGAGIVIKILSSGVNLDNTFLSIIFSALISALTVGGKAMGKKFAIDNSQNIVYFVAKILSVFSKE